MYVPSVAELIGDKDEFFTRHFNTAPMVRRAALDRDPRELLSVTDLDQVLDSEAIRAPYLDIAKDGRAVPRSSYTDAVVVQSEYVSDRILPDRVAALFRAGATLTWNSLNHYRPNLRALAGAMSDLFATRCDVIGFLTPAGRRGLAPHHDPVDVFVVQVEGTKLWRVWPVPSPRRGDDAANLDEAALGTPAIETTLRPGDVLYIPYNCPHVARAQDSVSLHLSVSVAPRRWSTLLQDVVADVVTADPRFWDNPWLRDPRTATDLPAMLALLADRLRETDPVSAVIRLAAKGTDVDGVAVTHHLRDAAAIDAIGPDDPLTRTDTVTVDVVDSDQDRVRARINGAVYALPAGVIDALDTLTGGRTRTASTLLADTPPDLSTRTARTLVRIGVLQRA